MDINKVQLEYRRTVVWNWNHVSVFLANTSVYIQSSSHLYINIVNYHYSHQEYAFSGIVNDVLSKSCFFAFLTFLKILFERFLHLYVAVQKPDGELVHHIQT